MNNSFSLRTFLSRKWYAVMSERGSLHIIAVISYSIQMMVCVLSQRIGISRWVMTYWVKLCFAGLQDFVHSKFTQKHPWSDVFSEVLIVSDREGWNYNIFIPDPKLFTALGLGCYLIHEDRYGIVFCSCSLILENLATYSYWGYIYDWLPWGWREFRRMMEFLIIIN
jgi:hypothetical protein